jgi:uncharacterized protein (UPF0276 family)
MKQGSVPLLVVNDTPLSRRLLQEGRLEADRFETSGPLTEGAVDALAGTGMPLLLHNGVWNWSLGNPDALAEADVLRQTRERLALTSAPWLSVHLGFSAARVAFNEGAGFGPAPGGDAGGMHPASAPLTRDALLKTMTENVRALGDAVGVPLLVENLDYNPTGAYEHVCEPGFVAEVLAATEADLLLDLAHAQVSASRLGYTVQDYFAELPLERVRQLHVSAPRPDGNTLVDAHEPLREADYDLLEELLGETRPWALTLEYGKEERALLDQLDRLRRLLMLWGASATDNTL